MRESRRNHKGGADNMSKTIEINGKSVQLREPYRAPAVSLVGMENQMKAILSAWIVGKNRAPLSPLVLGEAGVGKNTVVYECARISAKELFMEQGREDLAGDLDAKRRKWRKEENKRKSYLSQSGLRFPKEVWNNESTRIFESRSLIRFSDLPIPRDTSSTGRKRRSRPRPVR